jgi:hypothetical protein
VCDAGPNYLAVAATTKWASLALFLSIKHILAEAAKIRAPHRLRSSCHTERSNPRANPLLMLGNWNIFQDLLDAYALLH